MSKTKHVSRLIQQQGFYQDPQQHNTAEMGHRRYVFDFHTLVKPSCPHSSLCYRRRRGFIPNSHVKIAKGVTIG